MLSDKMIDEQESKMTSIQRRCMSDQIFFRNRRFRLVLYDLVVLSVAFVLLVVASPSSTTHLRFVYIVLHYALMGGCVIGWRYFEKLYKQIWRYSNSNAYLRLIISDCLAGLTYTILNYVLPIESISFLRLWAVIMLNMLETITFRCLYNYFYSLRTTDAAITRYLLRSPKCLQPIIKIIFFLTGIDLSAEAIKENASDRNSIRIGIIGAGQLGNMLATELKKNPDTVYKAVCFIDADPSKVGRQIDGLVVIAESAATREALDRFGVQELVFAIKGMNGREVELYEKYRSLGYRLKTYTLPIGNRSDSGKHSIREFQPEELLFRSPMYCLDDKTCDCYKGKVVLISGGGGSIGSELARQIARMQPKKLILLDIYENNVYDTQQELRIVFGNKLDLDVEIASVRDAQQIDKIFRTYRPEIVIHAAAHKHVPLMEHNCSEAVKNNVFGTLNMVNAADKYRAEKFVMVSTDKAVNPTNVMGATKRLCEMIVINRGDRTKRSGKGTKFSCTRFGNVLGSNGSVIPLFKRQIANGGPITLTDKRVIRYFMTISEASQLVLTSGAMAANGELFVLDMGQPVKILELAESMVRLSGLTPYKDIDIIETGLRPGEKLYEELLIRTEVLGKTSNNKIFVEYDEAVSDDAMEAKLTTLRDALQTEDDETVYHALELAVPTFHTSQHINASALMNGAYQEELHGSQPYRAIG